jgi:hypothetical protein
MPSAARASSHLGIGFTSISRKSPGRDESINVHLTTARQLYNIVLRSSATVSWNSTFLKSLRSIPVPLCEELSTCLDLKRELRWPGPTTSYPQHAPQHYEATAQHAYTLDPPASFIAQQSAITMAQSHSNKVALPPLSPPQR